MLELTEISSAWFDDIDTEGNGLLFGEQKLHRTLI
jgi:hypothetical protein